MSFGKESSFVFFMQDGILVNVGRSDTDATKQPLDDVELEVWRIFHEHRILKQSHERLKTALKATYKGYKKKSIGEINTVQEIANIHKLAKQALKAAEEVKE
jgi:hypothetical protein